MAGDESPHDQQQPRDLIRLFDREALAAAIDDPRLEAFAQQIVDRYYRGILDAECALDRDDARLLLTEATVLDDYLSDAELQRKETLEDAVFVAGRPDDLSFEELSDMEREILEFEQRALRRYRKLELDGGDD